jgi:GntR family transcriptional regulator
VYLIHRLRFVNQEPVLLERLKIPVQLFPELDRHDLTTRSLYEIMEKEYGVKVVQGRQSLEAVVATQPEAELLEVNMGDPLMLERRVSFDQDGQIVEYGEDLYRGDRFRFITEMAPLDI